MYTSHGAIIPGTRRSWNPPIRPARCGGLTCCPDCMAEAASIQGLDYSREEYYDENTHQRVRTALLLAGLDEMDAIRVVNTLLEQGILFRERKH